MGAGGGRRAAGGGRRAAGGGRSLTFITDAYLAIDLEMEELRAACTLAKSLCRALQLRGRDVLCRLCWCWCCAVVITIRLQRKLGRGLVRLYADNFNCRWMSSERTHPISSAAGTQGAPRKRRLRGPWTARRPHLVSVQGRLLPLLSAGRPAAALALAALRTANCRKA